MRYSLPQSVLQILWSDCRQTCFQTRNLGISVAGAHAGAPATENGLFCPKRIDMRFVIRGDHIGSPLSLVIFLFINCRALGKFVYRFIYVAMTVVIWISLIPQSSVVFNYVNCAAVDVILYIVCKL